MERKQDGLFIHNDDIRKAKEIIGWMGMGVLIVESLRFIILRPRMRPV